jgi:hypothetical protein
VHEPGRGVDVLRLAAGVAVARDLVGEVPGDDARVKARLQDVEAHAAHGAAALRGRARGPGAGRVDRADALPHEDARGVEAVEQRRRQRVLAARGVRADRLQARDDRVHVGVGERVAAAGRVLLQRGPPQLQRLAVELQAPVGPAQLAQPHARREVRLARDAEAQRVERRVAGLPEVGVGDAGGGVHRRVGAPREVDDGEAQRRAGDRAAHGDRARSRAVGYADAHVDHRGGAVQARDDRGRVELAASDRADRHRAVDAAEVEPRAVPGVGLHRGRVAPVGAHDEDVRAGGQAQARLEGQVGPGVARDAPAVDPHARAVVDRLEADRVLAGARHGDRGAIPGDRALEGSLAGRPANVRRVGRERHAHGAPGEAAVRPPEALAAARAVGTHDPGLVERALAARAARGRERTFGATLQAGGPRHQGEDRHRRRDTGSEHPPRRAPHQPSKWGWWQLTSRGTPRTAPRLLRSMREGTAAQSMYGTPRGGGPPRGLKHPARRGRSASHATSSHDRRADGSGGDRHRGCSRPSATVT